MGKGMRAGKKKSPGVSQKKMMGGGGQAQQMAALNAMQQKMGDLQDELNAKEFETSAGGGAVTVKMNGQKELLSLNIDPDVMDPEDPEMLQDLIIVAINEAIRQIEETSSREMESLTAGLGLPPGLL
ncbi:MAG: YbaB/EbfC family nucleoid-associated protein [Clostridiales Family XIII bacterium]|jgi:DNA-binding YbaB/EbfC family protein|nr:YbaB/EbfC family nucleoid-associated protein [Clostridiales Family XIII bacterium]